MHSLSTAFKKWGYPMLPHFSLACTGLKLGSLIQASRQMHVRVSMIVQRCKIKNLEAAGRLYKLQKHTTYGAGKTLFCKQIHVL